MIDACEYGTSADNLAIHLNEVTKYCYYPEVHSPGNVHYIFANKQAWEKLTPDLRELLKRETLAVGIFVGGANLELVNESEGKEAVSELEMAKKGTCSK